jgi:hypothetical protein
MKFTPLRLLIQEKLSTGGLPLDAMPRVWGGPGQGETCAACDETVTRFQLLMEGPNKNDGAAGIQMHVACFYLWDEVRRVRHELSAAPTPLQGLYPASAGI